MDEPEPLPSKRKRVVTVSGFGQVIEGDAHSVMTGMRYVPEKQDQM
jgi:hypothetical protein